MLEVYTDGACSGNPGPGGYGIVIIWPNGVKHKMSEYEANTTNNKMELAGPIVALNILDKNQINTTIKIYSDSTYVIKGITQWVKNWKRNGWTTRDGYEIKNKAMWQELDRLNSKFKDIKWIWIKGHNNTEYNELCDQLAVEAIRHKKGILITEEK